MEYERNIIISVGNSRKSTSWVNQQISIKELYERLGKPIVTTETYKEYMKLPKSQQDALKDVGGFVGGTLSGSRRKAQNVMGRNLVTLDFDNCPGWHTDNIVGTVKKLGYSFCIYSTRKHSASAPRLRIILPLDRTVSPDEYEPIARRIAEYIGISMADPTTFQPSRLMYWPSHSKDSEYVYEYADAPLLEADKILRTYKDWRDFTSWPEVPGKQVNYAKLAMKQGEPTEKPGIVGAFCRTYTIVEAMDKFLPSIYEPVDSDEGRFTYLNGSTTGGAVLYNDDKFLYSHHATDPCGGKLVNAFDLVRLHKFGDIDDGAKPDTPITSLPSYQKMSTLAREDAGVRATLNRETLAAAQQDFAGVSEDNKDWVDEITRNNNGTIKNSINNALLILDNDDQLRGKFALNEFANRGEVLGALPWSANSKRRMWSDTDNNGLYWYMERYWEITQRSAIDSALDIHAAKHAFNEVQDYINGLSWDNVARLDTLFIDYLGASDSLYNRAVTRKSFTAAVARAMMPGCKFDNMLILSGPQGIGKSTLLDKMSRGWFNDSIRTFEGKEASELLQGVWLVEVSELDAFRRTDVARIKQFLSLRADRYRAAYGRHVKELPRCCVFFGTTNTTDFLQDTTGNRRFWPVDVGEQAPSKSVFTDLTDEVINQIWAEAKVRWQCGEELFLKGAVETEAKLKQEEHREISVKEGMILEFIERKVPEDWQKWNIDTRRAFWSGSAHNGNTEIKLVPRDRICAIEIWAELFYGNTRDMKQADTREINHILARLEGWERRSGRFGPYNVQRGFVCSNIFTK